MAVRERRQILRSLFVPGSKKFWSLKKDMSRVLFLALIASADDEGRLDGDEESVKSIVPRAKWSSAAVRSSIEELKSSGLIDVYSVGSNVVVEIANFQESQSWHGVTRDRSKFPASPEAKNGDAATTNTGGRTAILSTMIGDRRSPGPSATATVCKYVGSMYSDLHTSLPTSSSSIATSSQLEGGSGGKPNSSEEAYETARREFRRRVGKSLGPLPPRRMQWDALVQKYGAEPVVEAIRIWASESGGKFLRTVGYPLAMFVKSSEVWLNAAVASLEEKREESATESEAKMVEFEGRQVPWYIRDEILAVREKQKRINEERKHEALLDAQSWAELEKTGL